MPSLDLEKQEQKLRGHFCDRMPAVFIWEKTYRTSIIHIFIIKKQNFRGLKNFVITNLPACNDLWCVQETFLVAWDTHLR